MPSRLFLPRAADAKKRSGREESALFFAVREGHIPVVEALLAAGADVNERAGSLASNNRRTDSSKEKVPGDTMLVVAIVNAHFSMADFLLTKGADPNLPGTNWTALHALARVRNYEEMQYPPPIVRAGDLDSLELGKHLIARGANVNVRGETAARKPCRRRSKSQGFAGRDTFFPGREKRGRSVYEGLSRCGC